METCPLMSFYTPYLRFIVGLDAGSKTAFKLAHFAVWTNVIGVSTPMLVLDFAASKC